MRLRIVMIMLGVSLCAAVSAAEEPEAVRLRLWPAREPVPALRYALLPDQLEMKQGNGAAAYHRAALLAAQVPDKAREAESQLGSDPLTQADLERARAALRPFEHAIHYAAIAARRQPVDWDLPLPEGFAMLLPELSHMRAAARAIALKARIEIAEGHFEDALYTLATGMAMARDLSEAPTLIHGLVGMAVGGIMLDAVEDLMEQRGSPNLYWALAMLPDPPASLRRGFETERHCLALWNPDLANPLELDLTPEGWAKAVTKVVSLGAATRGSDDGSVPLVTGIALVTYTDAKRYLVEERGLPREQVMRMPVLQVVAAYIMDGYRRVADEGFKWFYVDCAAFRSQGSPMERAVMAASKRKDAWLATMLLPAVSRAYEHQTLLQRRVNALQTMEALRMHAAAHDGELPASLTDAGLVPVPQDPVTGQPFDYERTAEGAVLSAPPTSKSRPKTAMRYALTIQKEETP